MGKSEVKTYNILSHVQCCNVRAQLNYRLCAYESLAVFPSELPRKKKPLQNEIFVLIGEGDKTVALKIE